jgi:hypothetical protein
MQQPDFIRVLRRHFLIFSAGLLCLFAAPPARAAAPQKGNDPANCPYCKNDPQLLKAAGLVAHAGFEFGSSDTGQVDALMAANDIRWLESTHFQLGFALGSHKVKDDEKKKIRAELDRLALVLPAVDSKVKVLDPWLRVHLYAQRCEDVYARFCELMQVKDADFPKGDGPWNGQGKYMGEGPYLGQKGKYEVLLLPSEAAGTQFLREQFGLTTKLSQRWNVINRDTLILVVHTGQGDLREDGAMHGHVAFNLAINMLDGYKHYSYDTPIWIREGLGHFIEREINPKFNTFDSSEGAVAAMTRKEKWEPEVRKMVAANQNISMAQLLALKDYAGLTLNHHYTVWSMTDFLVRTMPDAYAAFNAKLHGLVNKQNIPDGSNMPDQHRTIFQEVIGMSYTEFDAAWIKWVGETYTNTP